MNLSQQRALATKKTNGILGYIRQSITSSGPSALLSIGKATPRVPCPVLPHQDEKDLDALEKVQERATKMLEGLEHLSYEKRLRVLGLQPKEKDVRENLTNVYEYLKRGCNEDRARLCSVVPSARTRGTNWNTRGSL